MAKTNTFRVKKKVASLVKKTHIPSFSSLAIGSQQTEPLPVGRPCHTSTAFYESSNNHGSSLCNIRKYMPIERGTSNSRPQSTNKKQRPSNSLNKLGGSCLQAMGGSRATALGQEYSDAKLGKGTHGKMGSTMFTQRVTDLNPAAMS